MSNNLKKLVCGLLSAMMVSTSCGIAALAEDSVKTIIDENGAEVAATEVPETFNGADIPEDEKDPMYLDETPAEETKEVAEETKEVIEEKDYDKDSTYQTALAVCSALGIITGYEDGSIKPESTVTRAEMATIILRMLQLSDSTYKNVFTDVSADHWAAGIIQTAVEQAVVSGMGDGTFAPDGNVKYEQVIKMIVAAMGYSVDAEAAGGYPNGYISVGGSTLSLLKGVKGMAGEDMPRGEVIKAVYNALMAPFRKITGTKNGQPVYEANDTLGVEKFNLYEEEGVVVSTPNGTITSGVQKKDDRMSVDGVQYRVNLENIDQYLGTKVKFYYIDTNSDDPEVVAIVSSGKSEEVKIDADDIATMSVYGTNGENKGEITVFTSKTSNTTKKYKINDATVVYNGSVLTTADYTASGNTESFDDFIKPSVGSVKIVDYDADGIYDIVFVDSYETMLVTTATSEKLSGKINNDSVIVNVENDSNDRTITVLKGGNAATVKNLRKNDVVSLKRNIDESIIEFIVTGETVTGKIASVGSDNGDMVITVNGTEYKVDNNVTVNVKTGLSGTFYLDMFDRIGYIATDGALTGEEKYAMITRAYYNDEKDLIINLFTQEGSEISVKPAGSMKFWAPGATSKTNSPSKSELYSILNDDSKFIACGSNPIKLCKYTLNSANELSKLYVAVSTADITDTTLYNEALVVYEKEEDAGRVANMNGVPAIGGTLNGYSINDGIVEFSVPDDDEGRRSGENYAVGAVSASAYKSYDGGVSIDFAIGGFTTGSTKNAGVLVKFTTSTTAKYDIKELDTASIMPKMIISKINEAVDKDGNMIFEIKGYTNGSDAEVSYMTMSTTSIYKFTGWNERNYNGAELFDATTNDPSDIHNAIAVGDIIAMSTSGANIKVISKVVDAEDVAKMAVTSESPKLIEWPGGSSAKNSSTRETYYMGFISSVDIDDLASIGLRDYAGTAEGVITYDPSSAFNYATFTVDASGNIISVKVDKTGGLEASELYGFGEETNTYDYGLFSSLKGNMSAGYIIRVVIAE